MGRRVGDVIQNGFQFVFSFVAALYLSWRLTVVLLCSFPIIAGAGASHHTFYIQLFLRLSSFESPSYSSQTSAHALPILSNPVYSHNYLPLSPIYLLFISLEPGAFMIAANTAAR